MLFVSYSRYILFNKINFFIEEIKQKQKPNKQTNKVTTNFRTLTSLFQTWNAPVYVYEYKILPSGEYPAPLNPMKYPPKSPNLDIIVHIPCAV